MKLLKMLAISAAIASTSVAATTYDTVVQIDDLAKSLAWAQTTQMQFATVVLDADTINGNTCYTNTNVVDYNKLCPGDRTGVTNAHYTVTGLQNATVRVILDTTATTIEGIRFNPHRIGSELINLGAAGETNQLIGGSLTLVDRELVQSDSLTFTFDLEFSAQ